MKLTIMIALFAFVALGCATPQNFVLSNTMHLPGGVLNLSGIDSENVTFFTSPGMKMDVSGSSMTASQTAFAKPNALDGKPLGVRLPCATMGNLQRFKNVST